MTDKEQLTEYKNAMADAMKYMVWSRGVGLGLKDKQPSIVVSISHKAPYTNAESLVELVEIITGVSIPPDLVQIKSVGEIETRDA